MNPNGTGSWGILPSSSAIVLIAGVLVLLLAHQGFRAWAKGHHDSVREHLYGPPPSHLPADTPAPGVDKAAKVDDFDYGIYAGAHDDTSDEQNE